MAIIETIVGGVATYLVGVWAAKLGAWGSGGSGKQLKREVKSTLQAAMRAFLAGIPGIEAGPGTVALPGEAEALQEFFETPEVAHLLEPLRDGYLAAVNGDALIDLLASAHAAPEGTNRDTLRVAWNAFCGAYRAELAQTKHLKEVAQLRTQEEAERRARRAAGAASVPPGDTDPVHTYLQRLLLDTQHLTIQGIASGAGESRLAIYYPIEELYTPLEASGPACFEPGLRGGPRGRRPSPPTEGELCAAGGLGHGAACLRTLLRRQRHMLLLGAPGAGKTTFLRLIACVLAKDHLLAGTRGFEDGRERHLGLSLQAPPPVPVFVRLAALAGFLDTAEPPGTGAAGLLAYLEREHGAEPAAALKRALDGGRALLLLDGLDEVVARAGRERVVALVADALRLWGAGRLVLPALQSRRILVKLASRPHRPR